jgi:ribonuclease-3
VERALDELEVALGHGFARPELLVRALTHRSLANELALESGEQASGAGDNERLEFLKRYFCSTRNGMRGS